MGYLSEALAWIIILGIFGLAIGGIGQLVKDRGNRYGRRD